MYIISMGFHPVPTQHRHTDRHRKNVIYFNMQYASYTSLVPHSLLAAIWKSGMEKRPERRKGRYDDAFIQKKRQEKQQRARLHMQKDGNQNS